MQFMPCSCKIISELVPEIHTMEKCNFLKPVGGQGLEFRGGGGGGGGGGARFGIWGGGQGGAKFPAGT